ncbi:hypothetical protein LCGC14_2876120, partial [marine sediment metagenome]
VKELYDRRRTRKRKLLAEGTLDLHVDCVYPGFDDRGCWGWGKGPRIVPRGRGEIYTYTWRQAVIDDVPIVQIATWNDWFEGTIVEPSAEDGTRYLDITRTYAAKFKNAQPTKADLRLPIWIYRLRKTTRDKESLQAVAKACELIRTGRFRDAESLIKPLAAKLKIDAAKHWRTP